jgi:hypothetical protein
LICSSQWSEREQQETSRAAKTLVPDLKIISIPPGLDAREGSEGIVQFLEGAMRSALEEINTA